MTSAPQRPPHPRELLLQLIYGQYISHALYVAAELGLAEHLAQGAATPTDIARALKCDEWMLTSVLRKLEMCGVLQDDDDGRFSLTRMGRYLLPDEPQSLWSGVMLNGRIGPKCSEGLLQSLRSGDTAFTHAFGVPFYDYLERQPEFAEWFGETMVGASVHRYRDLTAAYDFSGVRRLVDVGAGQGGLSSILLAAVPTMRSVLFDLPEVIADARTRLEGEGLASRCEFVPGSFFDVVPGGGDLYLLANVLNNWRDRDAQRILHACRAAMTEGTTLLFVDALYAPPSQRKQAPPCWAPGVSLMATATRGGGSRDEGQWRRLLRSAGFELKGIRPLAQNHLFEAFAPN